MDLSTQIREYSRDVDAAQDPLTVDEIMSLRAGAVRPIAPAFDLASSSRMRNGKGWAVAAVVFVVVVLAGVLVGLLRSDSTVPVVDTPPPSVAPPATTAPPTTVVENAEAAPTTTVAETTEPDLGSGPVLEWEEIDGITSIDGFAQVVFDGREFLVIQHDCGAVSVVLSSSPDGISWDETSYVVDPPAEDGCYVWAATPQLALGAAGDRAVRIDRTTGEVAHVELPSLFTGRPIATGNGFFLLDDGRTLSSPDGLSWTEVTFDILGGSVAAGFWDVAPLGADYLAMRSDDEGITSSYLSQDGVNWTPSDCCSLEGWLWNVWGPGLLPWNDGVLAAVVQGDNQLALHHMTTDGVAALPHPPFSEPFGTQAADVRAGGLGIVVVTEPPRNEIYFSTDGATWTVSPAPDQVGGFGEGAVGPDAIIMLKWNAGDLTLLRGTIKDR